MRILNGGLCLAPAILSTAALLACVVSGPAAAQHVPPPAPPAPPRVVAPPAPPAPAVKSRKTARPHPSSSARYSSIRAVNGTLICELRAVPGAILTEGAAGEVAVTPIDRGGKPGLASFAYTQQLKTTGAPMPNGEQFRFRYNEWPERLKPDRAMISVDGRLLKVDLSVFVRPAFLSVHAANAQGEHAGGRAIAQGKHVLVSVRDRYDQHIASWQFDVSKIAQARAQWAAANWRCV